MKTPDRIAIQPRPRQPSPAKTRFEYSRHVYERGIDRRTLLAGLPAAAWLGLAHASAGADGGAGEWAGSPAEDPGGRTSKNDRPRLKRLELATAAPLAEMRRFYGEFLGLPILDESRDRLTVAGGETPITFVPAPEGFPDPFYHFAFNIPENKILTARDWQLERTPIEAPGPNLQDPDMPPEVVHFRHWDAHSIFFWDPGGNIVEYIARHTLDNPAPGEFSSRDILYASEIAFVTDDTAALADQLCDGFALDPYGDGGDAFRAVGDELGLLLVMLRGRQMGWANGRPIDVAPAKVEIRAERSAELQPEPYPYQVGS